MSEVRTDSKRRGRPQYEADRQVCDALLGAAEQCLETKKYKQITVREVAAIAGVNPAMINYYFDGKEGLFISLIEFLFSEFAGRLRELEAQIDSVEQAPSRRLVDVFNDCFYRHRAILWLLGYELLQRDSGIRTTFKKRVASRSSNAIRSYIRTLGKKGIYRSDADLRYLTFSVSTLAVNPIMIATRLPPSYDIEVEEVFSEQWLAFLADSFDRLLLPRACAAETAGSSG
jgi:AcrR family transcriptional regulator